MANSREDLRQLRDVMNEIKRLDDKIKKKENSKNDVDVELDYDEYVKGKADEVHAEIWRASEKAKKDRAKSNIFVNLIIYGIYMALALFLFNSSADKVLTGAEEILSGLDLSMILMPVGVICGAAWVLLDALEGIEKKFTAFKTISIIGSLLGILFMGICFWHVWVTPDIAVVEDVKPYGGFLGSLAVLTVGVIVSVYKAKNDGDYDPYSKVKSTYQKKLDEAEAEDDKGEELYWKAVDKEEQKIKKEIDEEIKKIEAEKRSFWRKAEDLGILTRRELESDPYCINELRHMLDKKMVSDVDEAVSRYRENRRVAEEKKKKEEEERKKKEAAEAEERKKREAEAARIRIQLEEERRLYSPGKVTIKVIDGDERSLNGDIWIDGGYYGSVYGYGIINLNPGLHNINARVKYGSYYLESSPQSFNLIGGSEQRVTFMAVNGRLVCIAL